MKYWLITDTHFGHTALTCKYNSRPNNFADQILDGLSRLITENDVLIHLGDFCVGNNDHWHDLFMERVKGKLWLVRGNHERRNNDWYLSKGWHFVCDEFSLTHCGLKILFSHMPQFICDYDMNIHGHFHDDEHRSQSPEFTEILTDQHKLLAIEKTNYLPVDLNHFIGK